jgi:hypothetical protein
VDQRITRDVERLAGDMAALVPTMVKPVVDILWFSSQLWALTGRRGMAVLYIYAALGFGCLRCVCGSAADMTRVLMAISELGTPGTAPLVLDI